MFYFSSFPLDKPKNAIFWANELLMALLVIFRCCIIALLLFWPFFHPLEKVHHRLDQLLTFDGQPVLYPRWDFAVRPSLQNPPILQFFEAACQCLAANSLERFMKLLVPDRLGCAAKWYQDFKGTSFCYYVSKLNRFSHQGRWVRARKATVHDRKLGFLHYTYGSRCNLST